MATQNIFNLTDTWNAGGTTFTAIKMNATDTASAAGSMLIDLQVGGASQFKVTKAGAATTTTIELGHASDTTLSRVSAGVVAIEGVEVTTNTATQTLTNKTLSSPTLSGTVAGTPTYSGSPTYNARLIVNERNNDFKDTGFGGTSTGTWAAGRFYADAAYSGVIIQADTSQSADLFLVRNSTDTANLASINASGSFFSGGVAIPTISSTDTLSNKTLSSPTLSGTVAGTPTFSGLVTFNNQVDVSSVAPHLLLNRSSSTADNRVWDVIDYDENLRFRAVNDAINAATEWCFVARTGTTIDEVELNATTLDFNGTVDVSAQNIATDTSTGTKIGTATNQKLGFFNQTPVVQPTAVADATDAASVITQLNALLTRMRNLGLIAT